MSMKGKKQFRTLSQAKTANVISGSLFALLAVAMIYFIFGQSNTLPHSIVLSILCIGSIAGSILCFRSISQMTNPFEDVIDFLDSPNDEHSHFRLNFPKDDETSDLVKKICLMKDQKLEAELVNSNNSLIFENTVNNMSHSMLITDQKFQLLACNDALKRLLQSTNHQLSSLLQTKHSELQMVSFNINGSNLQLNAFPLNERVETDIGALRFQITRHQFSNDGQQINFFEFVNRTAQTAVEIEVNMVVTAAVEGDLSKRIDMKDKLGFYKRISENINSFIDVNQEILSSTVNVLESISHGNLTRTIPGQYNGIYSELQMDTNKTVENLTEIIQRIRGSSESVGETARELSAHNLDLSQRTEEQASSLAETNCRMEEIATTVQETANEADQANELSTQAFKFAENGGEIVEHVTEAMGAINDSSKKIAEIIGVIDEIAFQTNLLALNAAVEAARAGEQGRGFAVVASEVRNLAQRSAGAAKEIKELINDSVKKADRGTELVAESGESLTKIVNAVNSVKEKMAIMSVAASQQANRITDIKGSIDQMDSMTQQNAALVEQTAASSESMDKQAKDMLEQVRFFNTLDSNLGGTPVRQASLQRVSTAAQPTSNDSSFAKGNDEEQWAEF